MTRISQWTRVCMTAALVFAATAPSWTAGQSPRTVRDGVYTAAQAKAGQALYAAKCAACHGDKLTGQLAPPLTGAPFLSAWDKQTVFDLAEKIRNTMPANDPGTLKPEQASELVAFLLQTGGFQAGSSTLAAGDAAKAITIVAPGGAPAAAAPKTAAALQGLPVGNMAQVMRGILFPSSNMIFNVQTYDPDDKKKAYEPGTTSFSWVDWGAGIYSGWELVDYAAISVAEAAPLLLTPRRCENGKPAPVGNADWIEFTQGMVEAGKAAYRASQSRNRDAVGEATNQLADACLNCHQVYRDKPGGTDADPSNKAARCVK